MGLEDQVCAAAPFTAKTMLPNLMQVGAFIAGFALAAFILLLDRTSNRDHNENERGHTIGALMLALAAVVALVAAYLFASVSGDHCMNSMLQFQAPTALMAIAALLLVSGIAVVAATRPQLAATASALRVMIVIAALLISVRFLQDSLRAASVSNRYSAFVDQVARLRKPTDLPAGSTSWLDGQLTLVAQHRWPGQRSQWPSLLAHDLYAGPTSRLTELVMVVIGLVVLAAGLLFRRSMQQAREAGPEEAVEAEERWRQWIGRLAVLAPAIIVATISLSAGGGELIRPPTIAVIAPFAVATALFVLITQAPLVGAQHSFVDSTARSLRRFTRRRAPAKEADDG